MRPPEPEPVKKIDEQQPTTPSKTNTIFHDSDDLESVEDYVEKVIHVRTRKVGYLIGTAGRTIRGFETNSGAKIDIMTPKSANQETPVLLSGTVESVRNVLRMIMELYHMNNLSSQLWKHIRNNNNNESIEGTLADDDDDGEEKIYAHEEMMIPNDFLPKFPKLISEVESESGVRVEVGREMEDDPGRVPLGVVGTAVQNVKAWEMIHDAFENYKIKTDELRDNIRIGMENWSKLQSSIASSSAYKRRRISSDSEVRIYAAEPRMDPFSSTSHSRSSSRCVLENPPLKTFLKLQF